MQEDPPAQRLKRTVHEYTEILNLIFESDVYVHLIMELDSPTYARLCRLNKHYHSRLIKFQGEKVKQWLEYQTHHWSTDREEKAIALARAFRMMEDDLISFEDHSTLSKLFFSDVEIYKFGLTLIAGSRRTEVSDGNKIPLLLCLAFSYQNQLCWVMDNLKACRLPGHYLLRVLPKTIPRFLLIELAFQGYDAFVLGAVSERQSSHGSASPGPFSQWMSLEDLYTDQFPMLLKNVHNFVRDVVDFNNPSIHGLMYNEPGFAFLLAHPYFISFSTFCLYCDIDYTENEFTALGFDVNYFFNRSTVDEHLSPHMSIQHLPPLWVWKKLWTDNPMFMTDTKHSHWLRLVCVKKNFRREDDPVFLFFVESKLMFDILFRTNFGNDTTSFLKNLSKRHTQREWEGLALIICLQYPDYRPYIEKIDWMTE
jgi:hypothetical protein